MNSITEIFNNSNHLLDSISAFVDRYIGGSLLRKCGITKIVDDVVVFLIVLREDDDPIALAQAFDGLPEGGDDPGVPVDGDGVGVVEHAHGQRRDQVRRQPEEPVGGLGLEGPEILKGVSRHLLEMHHLSGAPDIVPPGEMQLPGDGPVHLAVIADDDTGLLRQIFRADDGHLRGKQPDEEPEDLIDQRCFFIFH